MDQEVEIRRLKYQLEQAEEEIQSANEEKKKLTVSNREKTTFTVPCTLFYSTVYTLFTGFIPFVSPLLRISCFGMKTRLPRSYKTSSLWN